MALGCIREEGRCVNSYRPFCFAGERNPPSLIIAFPNWRLRHADYRRLDKDRLESVSSGLCPLVRSTISRCSMVSPRRKPKPRDMTGPPAADLRRRCDRIAHATFWFCSTRPQLSMVSDSGISLLSNRSHAHIRSALLPKAIECGDRHVRLVVCWRVRLGG